ncbi:MAG: DUF3789 domain-containing protein [Oscillospiraceae bacterium]|nr:DUF3789 domain-containing protein [Oscillospiraceae bacterium]
MIGFIIGTMLGGAVGLFTACLCIAAGQVDQDLERSNGVYGNNEAGGTDHHADN